jgi:hypothetical protein
MLTGESQFHISTPLGIWTRVPCDGKQTGSPLDQWYMVRKKNEVRLQALHTVFLFGASRKKKKGCYTWARQQFYTMTSCNQMPLHRIIQRSDIWYPRPLHRSYILYFYTVKFYKRRPLHRSSLSLQLDLWYSRPLHGNRLSSLFFNNQRPLYTGAVNPHISASNNQRPFHGRCLSSLSGLHE